MMTLKKDILLALLFMFSVSTILAEDYREIGSISGEKNAGEMYELYKSSASSFLDYLSGWKFVGDRDKTVDYSFDQIYEICLKKAQQEYGRYYSNLDVIGISYEIEYEHPGDTTYYSHDYSGDEYKKKGRVRKIYKYSAKVIQKQ